MSHAQINWLQAQLSEQLQAQLGLQAQLEALRAGLAQLHDVVCGLEHRVAALAFASFSANPMYSDDADLPTDGTDDTL